jgi:hypothetical protein
VGFEAVRAVSLKNTVFFDMTSCNIVEVYLYFGRTCCLHLQGIYPEDPEGESSTFLQYVGERLPHHMASYLGPFVQKTAAKSEQASILSMKGRRRNFFSILKTYVYSYQFSLCI